MITSMSQKARLEWIHDKLNYSLKAAIQPDNSLLPSHTKFLAEKIMVIEKNSPLSTEKFAGRRDRAY